MALLHAMSVLRGFCSFHTDAGRKQPIGPYRQLRLPGGLIHVVFTFSCFPVQPTMTLFLLARSTPDVSTSLAPVPSTRSIIFGFSSVVTRNLAAPVKHRREACKKKPIAHGGTLSAYYEQQGNKAQSLESTPVLKIVITVPRPSYSRCSYQPECGRMLDTDSGPI